LHASSPITDRAAAALERLGGAAHADRVPARHLRRDLVVLAALAAVLLVVAWRVVPESLAMGAHAPHGARGGALSRLSASRTGRAEAPRGARRALPAARRSGRRTRRARA